MKSLKLMSTFLSMRHFKSSNAPQVGHPWIKACIACAASLTISKMHSTPPRCTITTILGMFEKERFLLKICLKMKDVKLNSVQWTNWDSNH